MKNLILCIVILLCSFTASKTPNHREVYREIILAEIKYPDIAMAQAILESGHFKSNIAKQNNNFFGMRLAKKRNTTAVGQKSGYAIYLSWRHSVRDYKIWQDNVFKKHPDMTRSEYQRYLNKLYSTNRNYTSLLNTIIIKNKNKYEEDHNDRDSIRNDCNDSLRIVTK